MKTHVQKNKGGMVGYVGVAKGHPLYGKHYTYVLPYSVDQTLLQTTEQLIENKGIISTFLMMNSDDNSDFGKTITYQFNVHGGITYSGYSYWNMKKIDKPKHFLTNRLIKALRLKDLTGNDLFTYYHNKPDSLAKERVSKFYYSLEDIISTLSKDILEEKQIAYYKEGEVIFEEYVDDCWYFGWDAGHCGDENWSYDEAVEETERLNIQIENWTNEYYNI